MIKSTKKPSKTLVRLNNGERAAIYEEYLHYLRVTVDGNKTRFVEQYNIGKPHHLQLNRSTLNIHIKKMTEPANDIDLPPNHKSNSLNSLKSIVYAYVTDSVKRKDNHDFYYDTAEIIKIARTINTELTRQPDLVPQYTPIPPENVGRKWVSRFKETYPQIIPSGTPPNATRAMELTNILQEDQILFPDMCQTLRVYYDEPIKGYGLTTTAPIKQGTRICIYRGDDEVPLRIRDVVRDSEYVWNDLPRVYVDAIHPYSCFARYINENIPPPVNPNAEYVFADNTSFHTDTTDPEHPYTYVRADQNIEANEPITCCYNIDYWEYQLRAQVLPQELHARLLILYRTEIAERHLDLPIESHPYRPRGDPAPPKPTTNAKAYLAQEAAIPSDPEDDYDSEFVDSDADNNSELTDD